MKGHPDHISGPLRLSSSNTPIWRNAPNIAGEQGRMIMFAPELSVSRFCAPGLETAYQTNADAGCVRFPGVGLTTAYFAQVDGGSDDAQVVASSGGRLVLTTNNADNDSIFLGFWGSASTATGTLPFLTTAATTIRYGIKAKLSDIDKIDLMFGLTVVQTDPLATGVSDGIYFNKIGAATVFTGISEKNTTPGSTTLSGDLADDTYFEAGFVVNGASGIDFYVNGVRTAYSGTISTTLESDEPLCPTIYMRNFGAQANTMTIERLMCTQTVVAS